MLSNYFLEVSEMKNKLVTLLATTMFFASILLLVQPASASTQSVLLNSPETNSNETVIYDKDGTKVPMTNLEQSRGANQPTTIKELKSGAQYQSEEFSASGMRYGGYIFVLVGTHKVKTTLKKGNFTFYRCRPQDPNSIIGTAQLSASGSPYTIEYPGYFYFGAYNPVHGSTYHLQAM